MCYKYCRVLSLTDRLSSKFYYMKPRKSASKNRQEELCTVCMHRKLDASAEARPISVVDLALASALLLPQKAAGS